MSGLSKSQETVKIATCRKDRARDQLLRLREVGWSIVSIQLADLGIGRASRSKFAHVSIVRVCKNCWLGSFFWQVVAVNCREKCLVLCENIVLMQYCESAAYTEFPVDRQPVSVQLYHWFVEFQSRKTLRLLEGWCFVVLAGYCCYTVWLWLWLFSNELASRK